MAQSTEKDQESQIAATLGAYNLRRFPIRESESAMGQLGIMVRRLGVENWTEQDFIEDARRSKLRSEAAKARKSALTSRGWVLHYRYCSWDADGEYAVDPLTQERVSHQEAYNLQEAREPGSVPTWPVFDNNWKPPPSTEGLFHIGDNPTVQMGACESRRYELIEQARGPVMDSVPSKKQ